MLPSASNGAHSRICTGSVSASQTLSGECCRSLVITSAQFSPFFSTFAVIAPGVYCSRGVISFFSLSLFLPASTDAGGRDGAREHQRDATIDHGTVPATRPAPEVAWTSGCRAGAAHPLLIPQTRHRAESAGASTLSAATCADGARSRQLTALSMRGDSESPGGSVPQ